MTTLIEEYLEYHAKYAKIYGNEKTLVLMQVGGFYEAYGTDDLGPNLLNISKLIGTQRSKKGKNEKVSKSHPYFMGFPIVSLLKFVDILVENEFVVIIIDQIISHDLKKKGKGEERKVTNIYSKGTYIENIKNNNSNYIMCAVFTREKQKDSQPLMTVGISAVDVSTGHVLIHEAYSHKHDEYLALDETDRFIESYDPKEILIYFQNNAVVKNSTNSTNSSALDDLKENFKEKILDYLKLDNEKCRFYDSVDKKYTNSATQNEILKKVYPNSKSMMSIIEYLGLERNIYSVCSIVALFDNVYNKNPLLLNNVLQPKIFTNNNNLILGNNAISQLDVIEKDKLSNKLKFKSLFNVVNNTSTALGERFLKDRLLSPLIDNVALNKSYNQIENVISTSSYDKLELLLDNIKDIERLQRRIELKLLRPIEISYLISSYENIIKLIEFVNKELTELKCLIPNNKTLKLIPKFAKHIENIFIVNELYKYVTFDIETQIFKKNIYPDIDKLFDGEIETHLEMEKLKDVFTDMLKDNSQSKSRSTMTLGTTSKSGSFIKISKAKGNILMKKIYDEKTQIKIDGKDFDSSKLKFSDLTSSNIKITLKTSKQNKFDDPKKRKDEIIKLNKIYFLKELSVIFNEFSQIFLELNNFVSQIDFIKSSAKTAIKFGYSKPTLINKKYGYIKATKLRHPIIERLVNHEYIPHDVDLGNNLKGMMIYGLNACGKSSYMKAIGLAIIMAQSGMYVPCEYIELSPYDSLYTRITGDDNIFRGLSSFSLEMVELNAILKRANDKTLVIGDEVCRGTEHISGNALVASALITLSKSGASFIFASHLHEIMNFDEIKELNNVKAFHISVKYDDSTQSLIFDRQMKEGSGNQIYGVAVAQHIIQDKNFIDLAIKFRNKLTNSNEGILSGKTSKFNSNVVVYECHICGSTDKVCHISNLETHHINFQKDCVNGIVKNKKHLRKNDEANLVVLCNECHDKIHAGKIVLDKYVMTSKGRTLLINQTDSTINPTDSTTNPTINPTDEIKSNEIKPNESKSNNKGKVNKSTKLTSKK